MSLLVAALLAGAGALSAGALGLRALRRRRAAPGAGDSPRTSAAEPAGALAGAGFAVEAGEVISLAGREYWLEHAWLCREREEPVAAILFAAEATVVALPAPRSTLYRLARVEVEAPPEPPSTLDSRGVRFERASRRPVRLTATPAAPDPPFEEAVLAEYRALGGASLWMLARAGAALAWQGERVADGELERWGQG
ncbi:MAG: hypothetical protein OZ921_12910 [Sorangiineae bacterium]|nr:hypothetical protein [Polyangiaceae bacterium]MEB2323408.1 hypothetical protein [Sorangiineae bacterium]